MYEIIRSLTELSSLPQRRFVQDMKWLVMEATEVSIEKIIRLNLRGWRASSTANCQISPTNNATGIARARVAYLESIDEKMARSSLSWLASLGPACCSGLSSVFVPVVAVGDTDSSEILVGGFSEVEASGSVFFSFSRASSPSTLFSKASKTSVLGPLFFGTASVVMMSNGPRQRMIELTYRIHMGTGRPGRLHRQVVDGCI